MRKKTLIIGGAALLLAFSTYHFVNNASQEKAAQGLLPCAKDFSDVVGPTLRYLSSDGVDLLKRYQDLLQALSNPAADMITLLALADFKGALNAKGIPMDIGAVFPGLVQGSAPEPSWFALHSQELSSAVVKGSETAFTQALQGTVLASVHYQLFASDSSWQSLSSEINKLLQFCKNADLEAFYVNMTLTGNTPPFPNTTSEEASARIAKILTKRMCG